MREVGGRAVDGFNLSKLRARMEDGRPTLRRTDPPAGTPDALPGPDA